MLYLGHTSEGSLNSDSTDRTPRDIRELEAECVALLCCESLGLPGAELSRGYIQGWFKGSEVPERSAQRIFMQRTRFSKPGGPHDRRINPPSDVACTLCISTNDGRQDTDNQLANMRRGRVIKPSRNTWISRAARAAIVMRSGVCLRTHLAGCLTGLWSGCWTISHAKASWRPLSTSVASRPAASLLTHTPSSTSVPPYQQAS